MRSGMELSQFLRVFLPTFLQESPHGRGTKEFAADLLSQTVLFL